MDTIVNLKNVSKLYEAPHRNLVLENIELSVQTGDSISIMGPSGSGKSTLLNIIGTLDKATTGEVKLFGKDIAKLTEKEYIQIRAEDIGFIFQTHNLLPQCSVIENILLPTLASKKKEKRKKIAQELLSLVDLSNHLHHKPSQLSVGECQRVAVVRAMINSPKLLLADEPTGSLDYVSSEKLIKLLTTINETKQITLIVVTHSKELANSMKHRYMLRNGKLENSEHS